MKTDSLVTIDGKYLTKLFSRDLLFFSNHSGVVNSISQACGKLSFNITNYLHTQKDGKKKRELIDRNCFI
jgi:hypothetical protein